MNNDRRKQLRKIIDQLSDLNEQLQCLRDEEGDARNNLPENLSESAQYAAMDEALDSLEEACDKIEDATTDIGLAIA